MADKEHETPDQTIRRILDKARAGRSGMVDFPSTLEQELMEAYGNLAVEMLPLRARNRLPINLSGEGYSRLLDMIASEVRELVENRSISDIDGFMFDSRRGFVRFSDVVNSYIDKRLQETQPTLIAERNREAMKRVLTQSVDERTAHYSVYKRPSDPPWCAPVIRRTPRPPADPTKPVTTSTLPGLSASCITKIRSCLLKAHAYYLRMWRGEIVKQSIPPEAARHQGLPQINPFSPEDAMTQAFNEIAEVLLGERLLTKEVLELDLPLLVWDAAIAGEWWPESRPLPRTPFPIFNAEVAEWSGRLLSVPSDNQDVVSKQSEISETDSLQKSKTPVARQTFDLTPGPQPEFHSIDPDGSGRNSGDRKDLPPGPFPNRASWLKDRLRERSWSKHDLSGQCGPDHKTVQKILDGRAVREDVLQKVADALSKHAKHKGKVTVLDIPQN